jgi:hypothetical protein
MKKGGSQVNQRLMDQGDAAAYAFVVDRRKFRQRVGSRTERGLCHGDTAATRQRGRPSPFGRLSRRWL